MTQVAPLRRKQIGSYTPEIDSYHTRQLEDDTKAVATQQATRIHNERQQATPRVGELLLLYVDDTLTDVTPFGAVRHRAFRIMPEEKLRSTGKLLTSIPVSQMDLRWQAVDKQSGLCTKNLRPLAMALDFASSSASGKVWLAALQWMKKVFIRQQRLVKQPLAEFPPRTIPKRLRDFLLSFDQDGKPVGLRGDRYEFWVYRQLRKRLDVDDIYLDDSVRHRRFADDLVSMEAKADALKALDIPWLRQPVDVALEALFAELDTQWRAFDDELRGGKLKRLEFDPDKQTLIWHRHGGPGQDGHSDFLIQPVGQIDRSLIASEKANMDQIAATLGLKEMSQSVLMRKICTLSGHHRTRKAIFEFDKLIRSIYTLRYLRDPQLQRDVHRSENRIEYYHQLRSTITQLNGKKELTGRTDLDVAVSNHCGRLIANVVIAYNPMLLSGLLSRYLATGNEKALDLLRRISPAAWQHLHFLGHYAFRDKRKLIDLEAILAGIDWE